MGDWSDSLLNPWNKTRTEIYMGHLERLAILVKWYKESPDFLTINRIKNRTKDLAQFVAGVL